MIEENIPSSRKEDGSYDAKVAKEAPATPPIAQHGTSTDRIRKGKVKEMASTQTSTSTLHRQSHPKSQKESPTDHNNIGQAKKVAFTQSTSSDRKSDQGSESGADSSSDSDSESERDDSSSDSDSDSDESSEATPKRVARHGGGPDADEDMRLVTAEDIVDLANRQQANDNQASKVKRRSSIPFICPS